MFKSYFFKTFLTIFLVLDLVALGFIYYEAQEAIKKFHVSNEIKFEDKLRLKRKLISNTFFPLFNDAWYLASKENVHCFLDSTKKQNVEKDLLNFASTSPYYYQIRLLDNSGEEYIRVNNDGENAYVVPDSALQNKSTKHYFKQSIVLKPGTMYLSQLEPNMENGKMEKPCKPVIRLAIPIYHKEKKQGVLVINYLAKKFLQDIALIDTQNYVSFFLLNSQGGLLSTNTDLTTFGFSKEEKGTQFKDHFPEAFASIFKGKKKNVKTDSGIFYYRKVSIFDEIDFKNRYNIEIADESDYWVMAYHLTDNYLKNTLNSKYKTHLNYSLIATLACILIAYLVANMRAKEKIFIHELLHLNASLDEKVKNRTEQLTATKISLEEKVQALLSSIRYAKKVQDTILPQTKVIKSVFPQSFIMFLPKDIVAGDFYWMQAVDTPEGVMFAVADCTGHGVPGAMVSIVCYNALNKAVINQGITQPSLVLDRVSGLVEESFSKGEEGELNDGMDVSLCHIDIENRKLQWAGANNPLWLVRKNALTGEKEIREVKADRQPIGRYGGKRKPYTNHELQLMEDDTIYLFTDGFQDQFNDAGTEKLKKVRLKYLIKKVSDIEDLTLQREYLITFLKEWKGTNSQIDDICVVGIKI